MVDSYRSSLLQQRAVANLRKVEPLGTSRCLLDGPVRAKPLSAGLLGRRIALSVSLALVGLLWGCAARPAGPDFSVTSGPPLPDGRGAHAGGLVAGQIVVAGGTNWTADKQTKLWIQETLVLHDGAWRKGPALPYPGACGAYAHDASGLFIAGTVANAEGISALRLASAEEGRQAERVLRLGDRNGTLHWEELKPLPAATTAAAGAILDGTFYVCGGINSEGLSKRMYALDTSNRAGQWRRCADVPGVARAFATLVAGDGRLYLLGGLASWKPP